MQRNFFRSLPANPLPRRKLAGNVQERPEGTAFAGMDARTMRAFRNGASLPVKGRVSSVRKLVQEILRKQALASVERSILARKSAPGENRRSSEEFRFQGKKGSDMRSFGVALLVVALVFGFSAVAQAAGGKPGFGGGQPGFGDGQHQGQGFMMARVRGELT